MTTRKSTARRAASAGTRQNATDGKPSRASPAETAVKTTKQRAIRSRGSQAQSPPSQQAPDGPGKLSPEEIRALVAGAAYSRAEARGFAPGYELDDWYAAEAEINERLARGC